METFFSLKYVAGIALTHASQHEKVVASGTLDRDKGKERQEPDIGRGQVTQELPVGDSEGDALGTVKKVFKHPRVDEGLFLQRHLWQSHFT